MANATRTATINEQTTLSLQESEGPDNVGSNYNQTSFGNFLISNLATNVRKRISFGRSVPGRMG